MPPPGLGVHTREVLAEAGLSDAEIDALLAAYPNFQLGHLIRGDLIAMRTKPETQLGASNVTNDKLQRNCRVRVHRGKELVYEGDLDSLKSSATDFVQRVAA